MITGEALTGAIAERIEPRWLAAGLAAMGCLFFAFAWSGSAVVALLLFAAFGAANGFAEVVMMTAIHELADPAYQGRVFGIGSTIWRTTMLGAVALAPVVDAIASPAQAITVAAGFLLVGAVLVHVTVAAAAAADARSGLTVGGFGEIVVESRGRATEHHSAKPSSRPATSKPESEGAPKRAHLDPSRHPASHAAWMTEVLDPPRMRPAACARRSRVARARDRHAITRSARARTRPRCLGSRPRARSRGAEL